MLFTSYRCMTVSSPTYFKFRLGLPHGAAPSRSLQLDVGMCFFFVVKVACLGHLIPTHVRLRCVQEATMKAVHTTSEYHVLRLDVTELGTTVDASGCIRINIRGWWINLGGYG